MNTREKLIGKPDGFKRHRRQYGNGKLDLARSKWYAKHRQIRFAKRFAI